MKDIIFSVLTTGAGIAVTSFAVINGNKAIEQGLGKGAAGFCYASAGISGLLTALSAVATGASIYMHVKDVNQCKIGPLSVFKDITSEALEAAADTVVEATS